MLHSFVDVTTASHRACQANDGAKAEGLEASGIASTIAAKVAKPDQKKWNTGSRTTGVVDMANVMSKFLMFGMPLTQVVACATVNAAKAFPAFEDRGTLNVGAPADVAILELCEGNFEFLDNYKGTRAGKQRLFSIATVLAGKRTAPRS